MVSPARPQPVEHADRLQSRLDVRRLRDLRAGDGDRRRAAAAARSVAIQPDSRLRRHRDRADAARLGLRRPDRRRARRLSRPQAHHDARDPRLFGHDRAQRLRLGLGVLRGAALPGRRRDRLRMGDRRVDRRRAVARPGARPRRRADAMRARHRVLPRLLRLALRRRHGAERVALHVPDRRAAGAADAVGAPRHPGIGPLGARQRPAPGRDRTQAQRRLAGRAGRGAGALHRGRPVRRAGNPPARHARLRDVARHHLRVLGHLGLDSALYRGGRRQGRPVEPGMAELWRHGAQRHRGVRLCGLRLPCRCLRPQVR